MASPNPDHTPLLQLPSPTPPDPPDVPGDIKALAEAVESALVALQVKVFTFGDTTRKPISGTSFTTAYTTSWTMPRKGVLFVVGEAELNDEAAVQGDPIARLVIGSSTGPQHRSGIGVGSQATTITVPVLHAIDVTAAGAVTVKVETASSESGQCGYVNNCNLRGLFVGQP